MVLINEENIKLPLIAVSSLENDDDENLQINVNKEDSLINGEIEDGEYDNDNEDEFLSKVRPHIETNSDKALQVLVGDGGDG